MKRLTGIHIPSDEQFAGLLAAMTAQTRQASLQSQSIAPAFPFEPIWVDGEDSQGQTVEEGEPEQKAAKQSSMLDGIAQVTGGIRGDERLMPSLVSEPADVSEQEVLDNPSLADDYLIKKAYDKLRKEIEKRFQSLIEKGLQSLVMDMIDGDSASDVAGAAMCKLPAAGILDDPLGALQKAIEDWATWENLANLGIDGALDALGDKLTEALGLDELKDGDPAGAFIAQHFLQSYLLPELQQFLKSQAIGFLKDLLPDTLSKLDAGDQKDLLDRLAEALGMEGDAGCVPIAIKYDLGNHPGAITSPCATTVVVGPPEIPVARQGDGFECREHAMSVPVTEGFPNILVEGQPLTAHKMAIGCGARIVASSWHHVYVADMHPEIDLPTNDVQQCPAPQTASSISPDQSAQANSPGAENASGKQAGNAGAGEQALPYTPEERDAALAKAQDIENQMQDLQRRMSDESISDAERNALGEEHLKLSREYDGLSEEFDLGERELDPGVVTTQPNPQPVPPLKENESSLPESGEDKKPEDPKPREGEFVPIGTNSDGNTIYEKTEGNKKTERTTDEYGLQLERTTVTNPDGSKTEAIKQTYASGSWDFGPIHIDTSWNSEVTTTYDADGNKTGVRSEPGKIEFEYDNSKNKDHLEVTASPLGSGELTKDGVSLNLSGVRGALSIENSKGDTVTLDAEANVGSGGYSNGEFNTDKGGLSGGLTVETSEGAKLSGGTRGVRVEKDGGKFSVDKDSASFEKDGYELSAGTEGASVKTPDGSEYGFGKKGGVVKPK